VTPCRMVDRYRYFEGNFCHHLQSRGVGSSEKLVLSTCIAGVSWEKCTCFWVSLWTVVEAVAVQIFCVAGRVCCVEACASVVTLHADKCRCACERVLSVTLQNPSPGCCMQCIWKCDTRVLSVSLYGTCVELVHPFSNRWSA
jgi:hypothetical protein